MKKVNFIVFFVMIVAAAAISIYMGYSRIEKYIVSKNTDYDSELDRGLTSFASGRYFSANSRFPMSTTAARSGDDSVVEFYGPSSLYSRELFKVVSGSVYSVSTRIRAIKDDPDRHGAETYVGVVPYDASGKEIVLPNGGFLYPVVDGKVLRVADNWQEFEGKFSPGAGSVFQLPPGTASVRLVVLANWQSPAAISQIDYLRFAAAK